MKIDKNKVLEILEKNKLEYEHEGDLDDDRFYIAYSVLKEIEALEGEEVTDKLERYCLSQDDFCGNCEEKVKLLCYEFKDIPNLKQELKRINKLISEAEQALDIIKE